MEVTFEHISGSKKGQVERIHAERITIGRSADNLLAFDPQRDLDVSGSHATLSEVGGRLLLTDLGSSNGTLLNGKPIAGATLIEPGSKIRFGANGPEVRATFVAGPKKHGATAMLASVQEQMQHERAAAAAGRKRLVTALVVVAVVGVLGVVSFGVVTSALATRRGAGEARTLAEDTAARVRRHPGRIYALEEMKRAEEVESDARALFEKGDLRKAEARYKEAFSLYTQANDAASFNALAARREEDERRAAAEAARRMEEQRKIYEENQAALEARNRAELERLKREMEQVGTAERAAMQERLDRIQKAPTSDTAVRIIKDAEPSIVLVHAESYFQPKGQKERTRIAVVEATGFVLAKDTIVTAKHVLQPWKYDAKLVATARKLKAEQGFEIQDYVEVSVRTASGWEKKFDSTSGSCKVQAVIPDRFEARTQDVEIEWNNQPTVVPGISVHERSIDDLALVQVPGGALTPVKLADGSAEKLEGVIVIGTVRAAESGLVSQSPQRGEVQARTDAVFSTNMTVPASFGGAPVFKYDGSVWGIVVGTEPQNLTCDPASAIRRLLATGGGGAPR